MGKYVTAAYIHVSGLLAQEDGEESDDLDFLGAESDEEAALPFEASPGTAEGQAKESTLFQQMQARVNQRLGASRGPVQKAVEWTPTKGENPFDFDAEAVLGSAEAEMRAKVDAELARVRAEQAEEPVAHGAPGAAADEASAEAVDARLVGRQRRAAAAAAGGVLAPQAARSTPQDVDVTGPVVTPADFKLAVPPELDAYDPASGLSYVDHAEAVLAARSARRAGAVRSVFDRVLRSLGGARALKPAAVRKLARELGLPKEHLLSILHAQGGTGGQAQPTPARGEAGRAGSILDRLLASVDPSPSPPSLPGAEGGGSRSGAAADGGAGAAAPPSKPDTGAERRRRLRAAEHQVLLNSLPSPGSVQLRLGEEDATAGLDTAVGEGGRGGAILDLLVPPGMVLPADDESKEAPSSELQEVLALLESGAAAAPGPPQDTPQGLQRARVRTRAPPAPAARQGAPEAKADAAEPPVAAGGVDEDDDALSVGSTRWDDDDGVVYARAYFEEDTEAHGASVPSPPQPERQEAIASSLARLAQEPGMEFLRGMDFGAAGGGGYNPAGYPGM